MIRQSRYFIAAVTVGTALFIYGDLRGDTDGTSLTRKMIAKTRQIKTLHYTFDSSERIGGKMIKERAELTINISPFKVLLYQISPRKGVFCLYRQNENNGKVLVNPNSVLVRSINLDLTGAIMLSGRHHILTEAGYLYTLSIIEHLVEKYTQPGKSVVSEEDPVVINGIKCTRLVFKNPFYQIVPYVSTDSESILSIAKKLKLNHYSIIENNPGLKATSIIKTGSTIKVPSDYASSMELAIHSTELYPILIRLFDNKGLFEEYQFSEIEINPIIEPETFSPDNPKYAFSIKQK